MEVNLDPRIREDDTNTKFGSWIKSRMTAKNSQ